MYVVVYFTASVMMYYKPTVVLVDIRMKIFVDTTVIFRSC